MTVAIVVLVITLVAVVLVVAAAMAVAVVLRVVWRSSGCVVYHLVMCCTKIFMYRTLVLLAWSDTRRVREPDNWVSSEITGSILVHVILL